MKTPLTAKSIAAILDDASLTQTQMAAATGLERSTISLHQTNARAVTAAHLRLYLKGIAPCYRKAFLAAWLRDTQHPEVLDSILPDGQRLAPEVGTWTPTLPEADRRRLEWLAAQLAKDDELTEWFRILVRKLDTHQELAPPFVHAFQTPPDGTRGIGHEPTETRKTKPQTRA